MVLPLVPIVVVVVVVVRLIAIAIATGAAAEFSMKDDIHTCQVLHCMQFQWLPILERFGAR